MPEPDFEKSFGEFIDRREYDEAEAALFGMVRIAFKAGWKAAGGEGLPGEPILRLLEPGEVQQEEGRPLSQLR